MQVPVSRSDADGMPAADAEEHEAAAPAAQQEPSDSEGEEPEAATKKKVLT